MKIANKRLLYTVVVSLIVVYSTNFAILMTLERMDYRNYLQGEYNKNMYQLINSVENISNDLAKVPIIGSKEQSIVILEEIFRHSAIANDKLHSIPIDGQYNSDISKFLSQIGDFCYTLASKESKGQEISDSNVNMVETLKGESYVLLSQLKLVQDEISSGKVKWGEIRKKASGIFAKAGNDIVLRKFKGIQKQISQYPSLIYDGPFSDNVQEIQPKINASSLIDKNTAKQIVENAIGKDKIKSINISEEKSKNNVKIPVYSFKVVAIDKQSNDYNIVCEVTKKGGKVLYLLSDKKIHKSMINMDKVKKIGKKYLDNLGYKNVEVTYVLTYNNVVVLNYVYKQDDIMVYPDQVKLKITLDDGSIIGLEAEKYLISHIEKRNFEKHKISKEEAIKRLGKRLDVKTIKLAVIPTENNNEVLCYEFNGMYKNDNFIVYINSYSGYEEKIIQILNTPNGKLTM